jgi:shikimate kinase
MNIVLIGFMGTGKSTVGKILSKRLGWPFYDTDSMIEKETGLTVPQIFAKRGEEPFREMETRTVQLLSLLDKSVISTGGGIPLRQENMVELERNGWIVLLAATPLTIMGRLKKNVESRPLLAGQDPMLSIEKILREREKAYGRCKFRVDTDDLKPEQVAELILKHKPDAAVR